MSFGTLFPIGFMDPPRVLNASVTPIPGSASLPLAVAADTGPRASYAIAYIDSSGDYTGVYVGGAGVEHLVTIIGGGVTNTVPVVIPAHSRVSLRSITSSAITDGYLNIIFLGLGWNGQAA